MIEEKLIVSDTNIFIDLISINVLDKLFLLPCDICTTDFVVNEIKWPNQRAEIDKHIINKELEEVSFGFNELVIICELHSNSSTSMTDCSVWYLAKETGGRLLTGDGRLKKAAGNDNVNVSGILYIFDNLVEYNIVDKVSAAVLLKQLMAINLIRTFYTQYRRLQSGIYAHTNLHFYYFSTGRHQAQALLQALYQHSSGLGWQKLCFLLQ